MSPRVRCPQCGAVSAHYARGLCERCWRLARGRERWATLPRAQRERRLAQMRAAARARRAHQ